MLQLELHPTSDLVINKITPCFWLNSDLIAFVVHKHKLRKSDE